MNEADPNIKCQVGFFDDERAILRKHDEKHENHFVSKKAIFVTQCNANNRFK